MPQPRRRNGTTKRKLDRARAIVVVCMKLARKKRKPDLVDRIAEHILKTMPRHLARRLATSLDGQAMRAAMDLTKPYLA